MSVIIRFVLPDDILALLLQFTRLSEAEQDEILAIINGGGDPAEALKFHRTPIAGDDTDA